MKRFCCGFAALTWFIFACARAFGDPVNINTADAETLAAELVGVGSVIAAEIVKDREANGRFTSAEALTRVRGVGERIVEMNRENIMLSDGQNGE